LVCTDWLSQLLSQLLQSVFFIVLIIVFAGIGFCLRYGIAKYVTHKVSGDFAKIIIKNLSAALVVWSILLGISFGIKFLDIPSDLTGYMYKAIFIASAFSVTLVLAYIFADLLKMLGAPLGPKAAPTTVMGQLVVKLVVLAIGLVVILGTLGIEILPILASLGIGALAVALALQPTLTNLFAGLYLVADKPIRVGDYIKLQTGEEGYVEDIGWRCVRILTLSNNTVIVPNQRLAESIVLNYYYPDERLTLQMEVRVSYDEDPIKVEKILVEELVKASFEVDGMVTAYEMMPFVRFIPGYMDFSLNFTLFSHVREYVDQYWVQHELRKRIWERFKKEGITIPSLPTRVTKDE